MFWWCTRINKNLFHFLMIKLSILFRLAPTNIYFTLKALLQTNILRNNLNNGILLKLCLDPSSNKTVT